MPLRPLLATLLILCPTVKTDAQLPWVTQYREYRSIINPAAVSNDYTAIDGYYNLSVGLSYRNEGIPDGVEVPNTQLLQVNWASNNDNRFQLLLGGFVMRDQFGPTGWTNSGLRLGSFIYQEAFGLLSLGFNVGLSQWNVEVTPEMLLTQNDQALNSNINSSFANLGFGLFYSKNLSSGDDWYLGFSVPQLFDLDRQQLDRAILSPQYYGLIGANVYLSAYGFVEPSIWIKYLPGEQFLLDQEWHLDFNIRYHFPAPFWLGSGISTQKTLHFELGFDVEAMSRQNGGWVRKESPYFRLGLGYDLSFSKLPNILDNSLELNLAYFLHR